MSPFKLPPIRLPIWSSEITDIYHHLTPDEYRRLVEHGRETGRQIGQQTWVCYVTIPAVAALWHYFSLLSTFLILLAIAIPLGLIMEWRKVMSRRALAVQLLCESEYARQKGYQAQTVQLYRPFLRFLEPRR